MENKDEIKFKLDKKIVYFIVITGIIVFAVSFLIFRYFPESKKQSEINDYKKEIFNGAYCQYSCPLVEQTIQNKTQLLPTQACLQQCAGDLNARQAKEAALSANDLKGDNLFLDIESLVNSCRTSNVDQSASVPSIDNAKFFECVKLGLETIKTKYNYL